MINALLSAFVRSCLWLRYRVRTAGLEAVAARGTKGIVFLPNHPALIDPVIMLAVLLKPFAPRALADARQVDRFFIRNLARRVGVRAIPDMELDQGGDARRQIEAQLADSIEGLKRGENLLLYPAGHLVHGRLEDLGGNSAVELILQKVPDIRVVLVRTRGLWGSGFGWASGPPNVARVLRRGIGAIVLNGIFFTPRRTVSIEFVEPDDLPRTADRTTLNRYLERFYNADAPPATYVPYTIWERGGVRELPEAVRSDAARRSVVDVPPATRQIVIDHLRDVSGVASPRDESRLAHDLGLDSLARAELGTWLEKEFGFPQPAPEALQTVGDVMLAACGEALSAAPAEIKPPGRRWFWSEGRDERVLLPEGDTITDVFLRQARRNRGRAIIADQQSGVKTFRDVLTAIIFLKPLIEKLEGRYLGIMLPAGVTADVAYFAALFAGKTPVMLNWTVGPRNMAHSLDVLGVRRVLTARKLAARLRAGGMELSALDSRMVFLEDMAGGASFMQKLRAAVAARGGLTELERAKVSPTAAVLFTSGSESLPKAVPLTHANILANLRDVTVLVVIRRSDRLLGMLPPFHVFGLAVPTILPLCLGVQACYHPNPTEGAALAKIVEAYKATLVVGTPTFLAGIARAAGPGQLSSMRIAVTGAEKCPPRTYDALAAACPGLTVLEGYGITECSPIVSVNDEKSPRRETIGKVLPSFEYAIVDIEKFGTVTNFGKNYGPKSSACPEFSPPSVAKGRTGMLLVRGPCVFGGYLNFDGPSPFVEFEGKQWYRTGDLVSEDADGVLTFIGRLKRFVKLGGEMISLPAIEAVLEERFGQHEDKERKPEGPTIAVEATADEEHPEIVLFTTLDLTREQANRCIQEAGLSPLHNIRRLMRLDAIPILGTGKTDYRALKQTMASK